MSPDRSGEAQQPLLERSEAVHGLPDAQVRLANLGLNRLRYLCPLIRPSRLAEFPLAPVGLVIVLFVVFGKFSGFFEEGVVGSLSTFGGATSAARSQWQNTVNDVRSGAKLVKGGVASPQKVLELMPRPPK